MAREGTLKKGTEMTGQVISLRDSRLVRNLPLQVTISAAVMGPPQPGSITQLTHSDVIDQIKSFLSNPENASRGHLRNGEIEQEIAQLAEGIPLWHPFGQYQFFYVLSLDRHRAEIQAVYRRHETPPDPKIPKSTEPFIRIPPVDVCRSTKWERRTSGLKTVAAIVALILILASLILSTIYLSAN